MAVDSFLMLLDGREVDVALDGAVTATDYDFSMESTAPLTIAVRDQQRKLKDSGILDRDEDGRLDAAVEIVLDGARYRLAGVAKTADTFTLRLQDRTAALLGSARGQLKPKGGDHVAFARYLVGRVGARFVTPTGVAVVKGGNPLEVKRERAAADDRREKGIADGADVKIKGVKASAEQLRNADILLGVAAEEKAGEKATLAVICSAIGESGIQDIPNAQGSPYGGVLQALKTRGLSTAEQARFFLRGGEGFQAGGAIALAKANPTMSPGTIATKVEASGKPGSFYDAFGAEASQIIAAYGGLAHTADSTSTDSALLVQRGTPEDPDEDSWTCLGRMAEARGFRVFCLQGAVYYAREQDLIKSRPRATLTEADPGVDWIDWEVVPRKRVNVATVQCRASLRSMPPGCCVLIADEGLPDGRWLVSSFRRSRDSKQCTVELRRGTELLQPPKTREAGSSAPAGEAGSAFSAANQISGEKRAYLYGGGHGKALDAITGSEPLDCSSSTCLALKRAGVFTPATAQTSGVLAATWGEPGEGKDFTCWANSGHVFLTFSGEFEGYRFDTSPHAGDVPMDKGPRMRKGTRSTAGFTPRRVKGSG